jgi:hypothetical protein
MSINHPLFLNIVTLLIVIQLSCANTQSPSDKSTYKAEKIVITCTDTACYGTYTGPEFVNGSDVAHQFSNKIAAAVGDKLKELYIAKKYAKVNLKGIQMSTKGMDHRGDVVYTLHIPLVLAKDSCKASTSFDHRGGWCHTPNKEKVLKQFKAVKGLDYVFTSTPEGLTEYWLQWKSKDLQGNCK